MNYKLGTRGSNLSLAQTNWVLDELKKTNSSLTFDIEKITTKGDTDTRPLFAMEQKGIFEKEIDRAVAEKRVDFAVHSMKDVPSTLDASLTIACVPQRESVNDVLITNDGYSLDSIPSKTVQKQIVMILDDIGTQAVKIGMLHDKDNKLYLGLPIP